MPSAAAPRTLGDGLPAKLGNGPRAGYDLARVGSGLGRGPGMYKKLNGAPWSETFPAPGATLDLDFANDRGFVRGVGQGNSMQAVTFTRASSAAFVQKDGTLSTWPNANNLNLLTFPQDFDNAYWNVKNNITISATKVTAPDGTTTAQQLFETTANNVHQLANQNNAATAPALAVLTNSVYIKPNGRTKGTFSCVRNGASFDGWNVFFDLSDKSFSTTVNGTGTHVSTVISGPDAQGFYRISSSGTVGNFTNPYFFLATRNDAGQDSYAGDLTKGFIIWGAQLEVGSTATDYYPTNINVPRFDWASTAQIQRFQNYAGIISAGNLNTVIRGFRVGSAVLPANTQVTVSFYIKRNSATSAGNIQINNDKTVWANSVTQPFNPSSITQGVWFRVVRTVTTTNEGQVGQLDIENLTRSGFTPTATGNYGTAPNGLQESVRITDGEVDLELWGVQIELGGTATDYAFTFTGGVITNTPLAANPTCNGLLIEESRANRILWNRDGTNAAWVKTNVTATKDQTGIDGVASAATKLAATADNGTCIQTITLGSGSRTGSVFLKRITGTGNVQVSLDGSTWSTVDLSSTEWRRIVLSGTVTNPTVGIRLATNGDEVAMDYAQVEDGAFATSPILTTTASVTRSADNASMSGQNFLAWYKHDLSTVLVNYLQPFVVQSGNYRVLGFYVGSTTAGIIEIFTASNGLQIQNPTNNFVTFQNNGAAPIQRKKVVVAASSGNSSVAINGGTPFEMKTTFLTIPDNLAIGRLGNGTQVLNGTISRIIYIPKRLADDSVQALSR